MSNETAPAVPAEGPPPLAPEWLLEALPESEQGGDLDVSDSRFEEVSSLILRGDYVAAGRRSQSLLQEGVYDVRLLGYYLFGVFIERGLPCMPLVFRALIKFLGSDLAVYGPRNKKQIQTENMLLWLISGVMKNTELHSTMKDATWKQWMDPKNRPAIDEAMQLCPQMQVALAGFAPQSRAALRFQSLDGWLSGLGHSETGITTRASEISSQQSTKSDSTRSPESSEKSKPEEPAKPEAEKAERDDEGDDEDDDDDDEDHAARARPEHDDDEDDDDAARDEDLRRLDDEEDGDEEDRTGRHERPRPASGLRSALSSQGPGAHEGSDLWHRLIERLQAFEELVAQGQYLKAAVVATDIQQAIASFDPVAYFPALFAPYLTSFAEHMRPLEHYLNDDKAVKFKILRQLYQVDFETFMRKD